MDKNTTHHVASQMKTSDSCLVNNGSVINRRDSPYGKAVQFTKQLCPVSSIK